MTTDAALAGLAGSVALYVAAVMVDRRLEIALGRRNPEEWSADPRVLESREGWAALRIPDLFREPGWALGWLAAIGAFALALILLGVHWWFLAASAALYAGRWTWAERKEARAWGRQLHEEHSTPRSPRRVRLFSELRWGARFVMWLAFIAAPTFAAAAIASLF